MRTKSGQIYEENLNIQSILRLFLSNYAFSHHTRNAGTPQHAQHLSRKKRAFNMVEVKQREMYTPCTSPNRTTPCHNAHLA